MGGGGLAISVWREPTGRITSFWDDGVPGMLCLIVRSISPIFACVSRLIQWRAHRFNRNLTQKSMSPRHRRAVRITYTAGWVTPS